MGVALVPRLLINAELERGELVVACNRPLLSGRAYYLVSPEHVVNPPALIAFRNWLILTAHGPT